MCKLCHSGVALRHCGIWRVFCGRKEFLHSVPISLPSWFHYGTILLILTAQPIYLLNLCHLGR